MDKESRQFAILKSLSAAESVPGQELSETLGVSLRTIYRDIEELLEAGITIKGTKGADGGYTLHSKVEDLVRNSSSLDDVKSDLGTSERAEPSLEKSGLEMLPPSKVFIDRSMIVPAGSMGRIFENICNALQLNHALQIVTHDKKERVVMPLGLVFSSGMWLLISSDLSDSITALPLSALNRVIETALSFKPPKNFNIEEYAQANIDGAKELETIDLSFPNERKHGESFLGGIAEYNEKSNTYTVGPISTDFAVRWLASLGPGARVLKPKSVRDKLKAYAEQIAKNNS